MTEITHKQDLRRDIRRQRRALDEQQQDDAARGLVKNLMAVKFFVQARRISFYYPNDGEIDPSLAMVRAMERSTQCYYPVICAGVKPKLFFAPVTPGCRLYLDRMGIPSPKVAPASWLKPIELDVILLPLVAFDQQGARIGMGGGFYDASLAFLSSRRYWRRPRLIGIAHELQKTGKIQADHWDVPVEMIVTDRNVYHVEDGV